MLMFGFKYLAVFVKEKVIRLFGIVHQNIEGYFCKNHIYHPIKYLSSNHPIQSYLCFSHFISPRYISTSQQACFRHFSNAVININDFEKCQDCPIRFNLKYLKSIKNFDIFLTFKYLFTILSTNS